MAWQPHKRDDDAPDNIYHLRPGRGRPPPGEWPVSASFLGLSFATALMAAIMVFMPQYARGAAFPFVVGGWLISLCLHEFGHAFAAYRYGDWTVRDKGYLSLDPLKYTDPINSILFPILIVALGGIGLPGGAVFVQTHLFRHGWQRAVVSAAGPLANLAVLVVLMAILQVFAGSLAGAPVLRACLTFLALLQVTSIVFNLLPVPGFDGWGILEPWMPQGLREAGYRYGAVAGFVVLLLVFMFPPFNAFIWSMVRAVAEPFGLNFSWAMQGFRLFQFWK